MRIAVTGSSGKLGKVAVKALRAAGHRVTGFDIVSSVYGDDTVRLDCADFGAVMGALSGVDTAARRFDAVLHLAGIPKPGATTDEAAFRLNVMGTYNVFSAAARLGIGRVVWASSETILGLPFAEPPQFAPIDETHPLLPNWSYALGKRVGETMADEFARWHAGLALVSLRFSNVYVAEDYATLAQVQTDPASRKWNLWSYIDAEDAAEACRCALEAGTTGHEAMIIAAADNLMGRPSRDLMAEHFPGVPLAEALAGDASLLSSARAGELIGFVPRVSWRQRV